MSRQQFGIKIKSLQSEWLSIWVWNITNLLQNVCIKGRGSQVSNSDTESEEGVAISRGHGKALFGTDNRPGDVAIKVWH